MFHLSRWIPLHAPENWTLGRLSLEWPVHISVGQTHTHGAIALPSHTATPPHYIPLCLPHIHSYIPYQTRITLYITYYTSYISYSTYISIRCSVPWNISGGIGNLYLYLITTIVDIIHRGCPVLICSVIS